MYHYQKGSRQTRSALAWGLIVLGLAGLLAAWLLHSRSQPTAPLNKPSAVHIDAVPSSTKPSPQQVASYVVASDLPKYLSIPAIGIDKARVIQLGLLRNNQIASPPNIYDAGWYKGSARPGASGAMFIYGHVSSWTAGGLFQNLHKLKSGDQIVITRGNDTTVTYQVVSSRIYPQDHVDMNAVLSPVDPLRPGLNLMTCTGHVIKGTSEFDERLVVFSKLQS